MSQKETIIAMFKKCRNNLKMLERDEFQLVIENVKELDFFSELKKKIGLINIKELCLNMNIIFYPENSKVNRIQEEKKCFIEPILGDVKRIKDNKNIEFFCNSDAYFMEFNMIKYVQITHNGVTERLRKFSTYIPHFIPFKDITQNEVERLFLVYDKIKYKQGEYLYHEGDELNGVFFVMKGDFLVSKKLMKESTESQIDIINRELTNLKHESAFYNYLLNRDIGLNSRISKDYIRSHFAKAKSEINDPSITKALNQQHLVLNLLNLNKYEIVGQIEYIRKIPNRIFSVQAKSSEAEVWFFPFDKLYSACHRDRKEGLTEYSMKQCSIFSKTYTNLVEFKKEEKKHVMTQNKPRNISRNKFSLSHRGETNAKKCLTTINNFYSPEKIKSQSNLLKVERNTERASRISPSKIILKKINFRRNVLPRFESIDATRPNNFANDTSKKKLLIKTRSDFIPLSPTTSCRTERSSRNDLFFTSKDWLNNFYAEKRKANYYSKMTKKTLNVIKGVPIEKLITKLKFAKRTINK